MEGRESKESNNLFFVCSLIEYIARKTKNHRSVVVNAIGKNKLQHIYDLADIYHSENIDKLTDELIQFAAIKQGHFDNIAAAKYSIPTHWDIGKVYKRLILSVASQRNTTVIIAVLLEVYNTWISRKLEDLNSSLYYENADYIFQSFLAGELLE
ncbi:MAG: hypothetical protein KA206_04830 [Paludibacter sp.]|nr:hypothetical protein [Paludibacter sp.]